MSTIEKLDFSDILYISYVKLEDKGAYQAAYYSDILRMTVVVMDFIISVTGEYLSMDFLYILLGLYQYLYILIHQIHYPSTSVS